MRSPKGRSPLKRSPKLGSAKSRCLVGPSPSRKSEDGSESEDSINFPALDAAFLESSAFAKNIFRQINNAGE